MYGDYQCPFTRVAYREVGRLERRHGDSLRFVYRHFPMREIHAHAQGAAEASEASSAQSRFWEMHDVLFRRQRELDPRSVRRYAERLELDVDRLALELSEHVHAARVEHDLVTGIELGVRGTPGIFVDGLMYRGPYDPTYISKGLGECVGEARNARAS